VSLEANGYTAQSTAWMMEHCSDTFLLTEIFTVWNSFFSAGHVYNYILQILRQQGPYA